MNECILCKKLELIKNNKFEYLIHEFKNTYLILSDHQYFKGYSQIIYKNHIRDMLELDSKTRLEIMDEVFISSKAISDALNPWKLNQSCYGNAVPHIHWHLFPRYENEPDRTKVPWFYMNEFDNYPTKNINYTELILQFRQKI